MRTKKFNFQWFEKEDRRKAFRASVSRDGKLHLGKSLREHLPPSIQIGWDASAMTLAIADGHGAGIDWPACGVFTPRGLAAQLTAIGLPPPHILPHDPRRTNRISFGQGYSPAQGGQQWKVAF